MLRAFDALMHDCSLQAVEVSARSRLHSGPWARQQRILSSFFKDEGASRAAILRAEAAEVAYIVGRESRDLICLVDRGSSSYPMTAGTLYSPIADAHNAAALPHVIANELLRVAMLTHGAVLRDFILSLAGVYQEFVRAMWGRPTYFINAELSAYNSRALERAFGQRVSAPGIVSDYGPPRGASASGVHAGNATRPAPFSPASAHRAPAELNHAAGSSSVVGSNASPSHRSRVTFDLTSSRAGPSDSYLSGAHTDPHAALRHHQRRRLLHGAARLLTPAVSGVPSRAPSPDRHGFASDSEPCTGIGWDRGSAKGAVVSRDARSAHTGPSYSPTDPYAVVFTSKSARAGVLSASVRFEHTRQGDNVSSHPSPLKPFVIGVAPRFGDVVFGWRSDGYLTTDSSGTAVREYGHGGFAAGDIVTVLLNLMERTLSFSVDAEDRGVAMKFNLCEDPEALHVVALLPGSTSVSLV
jgi:hypothetical protein